MGGFLVHNCLNNNLLYYKINSFCALSYSSFKLRDLDLENILLIKRHHKNILVSHTCVGPAFSNPAPILNGHCLFYIIITIVMT